jgi:hypothetical protein
VKISEDPLKTLLTQLKELRAKEEHLLKVSSLLLLLSFVEYCELKQKKINKQYLYFDCMFFVQKMESRLLSVKEDLLKKEQALLKEKEETKQQIQYCISLLEQALTQTTSLSPPRTEFESKAISAPNLSKIDESYSQEQEQEQEQKQDRKNESDHEKEEKEIESSEKTRK